MSDKICEICKNPIEECEEIISCPDCGKEFHKKCWRLTGKCCVNEECRQKARERKEAEKQEKEKVLAEQNTETEKSVKFCPKCGKELNDEEIFCGKCGEPVSKEPEVPKKRICSKCGRELNDEEVFCCKCGIEYNDTPVTKNANKKPIYKRKWFAISAACVCVVALISIIAGIISANQVEPCTYHSWETVEVIKEATCTEQGLETQKCSVCKEKREHVISAKGHRCKTTILKKKSCTEDGAEELVCSVCGHKETKVIPSCHNWVNATCTNPKTCSVCGKTEGTLSPHLSDKYGICSACGKLTPSDIDYSLFTIISGSTIITDCIETDLIIKNGTTIECNGILSQNVIIEPNGKLVLSGIIGGNLILIKGSSAIINGTVGNSVHGDGYVDLYGIIAGNIDDSLAINAHKNSYINGYQYTKDTILKNGSTAANSTVSQKTNKTFDTWQELYNIICAANENINEIYNFLSVLPDDYRRGFDFVGDLNEAIKSANLLNNELAKAKKLCGDKSEFSEAKSLIVKMCSELENIPSEKIESADDEKFMYSVDKMTEILYAVNSDFVDLARILAVKGYDIIDNS